MGGSCVGGLFVLVGWGGVVFVGLGMAVLNTCVAANVAVSGSTVSVAVEVAI